MRKFRKLKKSNSYRYQAVVAAKELIVANELQPELLAAISSTPLPILMRLGRGSNQNIDRKVLFGLKLVANSAVFTDSGQFMMPPTARAVRHHEFFSGYIVATEDGGYEVRKMGWDY